MSTMIRKTLCFIMLILCLSACSSFVSTWNFSSNVKRVCQGMTKEQVISIMGKSYNVEEAVNRPNGYVEAISYNTDEAYYLFKFTDDRLEEWHRESPIRKE